MAGNYSLLYTESAGNTILASRHNAEHQNHIDNMNPAGMDDYSATVAQMKITEDPGEDGTESQASSLQGELTRLRHAILETKQKLDANVSYWYETPTINAAVTGPASSVDNTIPRFDSTSGGVLQESLVTISDQDVVTIPNTTITTSGSGTAYTATTVADGSAWDLSGVKVGDLITASGGSTGTVTVIDDGADTLTVGSWTGGTPSAAEVATVTRPGSLNVEGGALTVGDGSSTGTDPDITIDSDSGDATIRLQVNNSSSNAWDIKNDNSSSDRLKFYYNGGTEVLAIKADNVDDVIEISGDTPARTVTPTGATIYPNALVQAHGFVDVGVGTIASQSGYNYSASYSDVGEVDISFNRNMANANYTVIAVAAESGAAYATVISKSTSGFTVLTWQSGGTAAIRDFHFVVLGQMS